MESNARVEEAEKAAAAWLLKRENSQWSSSDENELAEWLKASTGNRVAYLRLRSVWREIGRLKVISTGGPLDQVPARGVTSMLPFFRRNQPLATASSAPIEPRRSHGRLALAASIFLVVGIAAFMLRPSTAASYRTPVGGLAVVPMADGSKITLNTDSEIVLGDSNERRRVYLKRGEAFFEVAKDPSRPFVVYANEQRVVAVGTKFAVRLKPETVQVAVTEGLVRLEPPSSRLSLNSARPINADAGAQRTAPLLTAGTIANAKDQHVTVQQQSLADVEQSLSWRTGFVVLRKARLGDAVSEFNRYNHRELVIGDPALAGILVGGNFRADNIDGFVRLLKEGFQIQAEQQGNRIILSSGTSLR